MGLGLVTVTVTVRVRVSPPLNLARYLVKLSRPAEAIGSFYAAAAAKFADDLERHGADGACVAAARERGRNALRHYTS